MADIVEIVHRINYEVNDTALQNATTAIQLQIQKIETLNTVLARYRQELNTVRDSAAISELARKVDSATRQMESSFNRAKGIASEFFRGFARSLGGEANLEDAVAKWLAPLHDRLYKVKTEGGGAATSLGGIANKLVSFSGLAPLAVTLFTSLADEIFSVSEETRIAAEEQERYNKALKDSTENARKQYNNKSTDLLGIRSVVEDKSIDIAIRKAAVQQLQQQYSFYAKGLTISDFLAGRTGDFYQKVDNVERAKATEGIVKDTLVAAQEQRMKELAEQKKAEASLAKARKDLEIAKKNRSPEFIGDGRRNELLRAAELSYNSALKAYEKSTNTLRATEDRIQVAENTFKKVSKITAAVNFYRPEDDDTKNASKPSVRIKKERTTETKGPVQIVVDDTLIQLLVRSLEGDHVGGIRRDHAMWDSALQQETVAAVASSSSPELTVSKRIPSKTEKFLFGKTAETQDGEERRREEIQKSIAAYQSLVNAAVQAFQTIYDAQIKALDAEIAIRQKRVEAATKLAEKGNTEVLKIEQERLDKAQKQREEFARRQQIINAALAVSNAVLAVAQAAGETGPGAIAVVPAVIAAIIAGYAAISAATRESTAQAFADGVVGFRGKGGPREDANWVRISSGESVITAKGTAANHSILEAINKGAEFRMLDAKLISAVPSLNFQQTGFASKDNLKSLEKKLDGVIEAVRDNQFKQDVFFNEHGVGLLTQRAIRKDQNRFK